MGIGNKREFQRTTTTQQLGKNKKPWNVSPPASHLVDVAAVFVGRRFGAQVAAEDAQTLLRSVTGGKARRTAGTAESTAQHRRARMQDDLRDNSNSGSGNSSGPGRRHPATFAATRVDMLASFGQRLRNPRKARRTRHDMAWHGMTRAPRRMDTLTPTPGVSTWGCRCWALDGGGQGGGGGLGSMSEKINDASGAEENPPHGTRMC